MASIEIGTSGYSFGDWVGTVYPPDARQSDFLKHYARLFQAVEVNATYYRIPPPVTFERMLAKVSESFVFVVKAPKEMTHERSRFADAVRPFNQAIRPLIEARQLGGLLAQFPFSFRPCEESAGHLARLADAFVERLPVNVEFRHSSWMTDDTFRLLERLGLGFVNVDLPHLPNLPTPTETLTSSVAYVRLHGRNAKMWWRHPTPSHRYDYTYTQTELDPWAKSARRMAEKAKRAFVFTNNCRLGQSVISALRLMEQLGLPPVNEDSRELFGEDSAERIQRMEDRILVARRSLADDCPGRDR